MKHVFGRIVAYTVLYCGVIFGIFVLQFTKGQAFSLSLGAMTVTGRQEQTESGETQPLLPLHIVSNGLDVYISEQNPVYAVDETETILPLRVLTYQKDETDRCFSVRCSESVVLSFFSEKQGDIDTLRIEAVLPENVQKVLLPWKITRNAGIERADGKLFVRSGKNQYAFIGSFGFNTEADRAEQSEIPHLVLERAQPVAYYKTYLPLQELDIAAIPSMTQASDRAYEAALNTFTAAVLATATQALSSKKITEKTLTAYVAEMGQRGRFAEAIEKAPTQTLAKNVRTYLSNPFYDNVQSTHTGLAASDTEKRERYAALIKAKKTEIFEYEDLIPFLTDRGTKRITEDFFQLIAELNTEALTAQQAAGLLAVWLDCTHYYPDKKPLFTDALPLCEKKITDSLLLIDEGLYLSNDGTYIDSANSLIAAQILLRYGAVRSTVWQSVARMLITSLLRYSGESAGLPVGFTVTGEKTQLGLIADDSGILDAGSLYPLVIPHNSWYPHAESLALQAEPGIWAWTCAQHIEVLENTAKTLLLRIKFPEGQSHYLTLHGIRPFYRIELYGIPFRSDARFEMYNSSGYAYDASNKILYLKMRHKSEYETIKLSIGAAPQQSPIERPASIPEQEAAPPAPASSVPEQSESEPITQESSEPLAGEDE